MGMGFSVGMGMGFSVGMGMGFPVGMGMGFSVGMGMGFPVGMGMGFPVGMGMAHRSLRRIWRLLELRFSRCLLSPGVWPLWLCPPRVRALWLCPPWVRALWLCARRVRRRFPWRFPWRWPQIASSSRSPFRSGRKRQKAAPLRASVYELTHRALGPKRAAGVEKHSNGTPPNLLAHYFYLWEPAVVRQQGGFLPRSGGHSSSY